MAYGVSLGHARLRPGSRNVCQASFIGDPVHQICEVSNLLCFTSSSRPPGLKGMGFPARRENTPGTDSGPVRVDFRIRGGSTFTGEQKTMW